MLVGLIDWMLAHRPAVLLATLLAAGWGAYALHRLPLDAFPDTTPVQVQVNTVAETLGAVEVERQVTVQVEQALSGLPQVEELRSLSKFGLSQVTVRFADGTDIWFARQVVAERLAGLALPHGLSRPSLGPVSTGLGEVFHYLVRGKGKSLEELRTVHDFVLAPQLRAVPGVAEVNAWGGAEKQWHVVVDPRLLQKFGLSLGDLYLALEENNASVGGGQLERGGGAALVLGVGQLGDRAAIGEVVIAAREGVPVRVRDVARVEVGHAIRRAAVTAGGTGEVVLGLGFMRMGENSDVVTRALSARLSEARGSLPEGFEVEIVHERTTLVDRVLRTVRTNLVEGALLVIAVLFVFLGNLRAGLVVAAAIPLSMLLAFDAMLRFGVAGSLMSLGAIDFGLVVDSSVIVVENAERRLAEEPGGRSAMQVIRDAVVEVRKPTLFGELIILIVYVPVLALEGVEGKMFRPMALTAIFALAASMILSLTVVPVLASLGLRRGGGGEPRLVRWLRNLYAPVLDLCLSHRRAVLGGALVLLAATALLATRLGSEFVPRLSEGTLVINTVRLAEVSLSESVRYGTRIEQVILERFPDEVERIWTRTGTPEVATDPMGLEVSDVFVTLKPREEWRRAKSQDGLVRELEAELADLPGMRLGFVQPIEMRLNELVAGARADVAIKVFGDDLDLLTAKAREIEAVVRGIEGAADVTVEQTTGQPVLQIVVDRAAIGRHGIPARAVLDVIEAVGGRSVGEIREAERRFELAVVLDERFRGDPEALKTVLVPAPDGTRVPLGRLASFEELSTPTAVLRDSGKRRVVVQTNVRGRDLGGFVAEAREAIHREVPMPAGNYVRFGGQFENLERARERLMIVVPLALALIFLLLYASYRSAADALRIFTAVPFALAGGVLALLARGLPFSISAAVGFIALFGVAVLNGLVLVSRIRQLLEGGASPEEAVREAASSRLRPVLMTASVAAIGFLPMALATGVGAEVQRPLATVVIGGIFSSTLLTLLVLPVLCIATGRRRLVGLQSAAALVAAVLLGVAPGANAAAPAELREARAVELALERSPELAQLVAERDAARSLRSADGRWLRVNPELAVAAGPTVQGTGGVEGSLELSQELELGGQRGQRLAAAEAGLAAAEARLVAGRGAIAAQARLAFGALLAAGLRRQIAVEGDSLAREALRAAQARAQAGAAAKLEVNAARVEVGRAARDLAVAEAAEAEALAALRLLIGLEPADALQAIGELGAVAEPGAVAKLPSIDAAAAAAARADVVGARREARAARAEQALEEAAAVPGLRVGLALEREEGASSLQGTLGIPLPLFDRNQGPRALASARAGAAGLRAAAAARRAEEEIRLAVARYAAARKASDAFGAEAVEALSESLALVTASYQAGKVDFLQLLVIRRETLEGRRAQVDTQQELHRAGVELQRALGAGR